MGEHFVLFKPKDIVSGDFYWAEEVSGSVLFGVIDCTGHGVPGAIVSVVGHNALNRCVREFEIHEPSAILDQLNTLVKTSFSHEDRELRDGMDMALCKLDSTKRELQFAGANNGIWIVRNAEVIELKADKQPIGHYDDPKPFSNHKVALEPGDTLYLFSDGYVDQFGGPSGKKLKSKGLKELILSMQELPMKRQLEKLDSFLNEWRGSIEQIDDVCIVGVRV